MGLILRSTYDLAHLKPTQNFWQFVWHSPTLTTWGSFVSRSSAILLVLPLALKQFSPAEITLWNILMRIALLQLIIDLGFTPTFTRLFAFAHAGASSLGQLGSPLPSPNSPAGQPNWGLVARIYRVTQKVYLWLGLVYFGVLALVGSYYVYAGVQGLPEPAQGWAAWGLMLAVSFVSLRANQTKAFIEGLNQVALLRRWEILTSLGGVLTTFLVFYFGGGIFAVILASQAWILINIGRNYYIMRGLPGADQVFGPDSSHLPVDPQIFRQVWSAAWRTGVGTLLTAGTFMLVTLQTTDYLLARSAAEAAVFSTAMRIMDSILDFSVAPLYSKLPRLASLYSQGEMGVLMGVARQGMQRSYLAFVLPVVLAGVFGAAALAVVGSQVAFPPLGFWGLLALAHLLQRVGANHLQLYSLSNRIIWHKAGAGLAAIFALVWLVALPRMGMYAYPLAGLVSAVLFYTWYCARHSYLFFQLDFWTFEPKVSFLPAALLFSYTLLVFGGYKVQIAPEWAVAQWVGLKQWLVLSLKS
jgi:hypothetical protein